MYPFLISGRIIVYHLYVWTSDLQCTTWALQRIYVLMTEGLKYTFNQSFKRSPQTRTWTMCGSIDCDDRSRQPESSRGSPNTILVPNPCVWFQNVALWNMLWFKCTHPHRNTHTHTHTHIRSVPVFAFSPCGTIASIPYRYRRCNLILLYLRILSAEERGREREREREGGREVCTVTNQIIMTSPCTKKLNKFGDEQKFSLSLSLTHTHSFFHPAAASLPFCIRFGHEKCTISCRRRCVRSPHVFSTVVFGPAATSATRVPAFLRPQQRRGPRGRAASPPYVTQR